jgi:purine-binding chemotaxis protein CheW
MSAAQTAATIAGHFLTFRLGEELFAVDVSHVREILDLTPITRVPGAPEHMRGVVNVRGKAVPVVDLRRKFGLPPGRETVHTRIVAIELCIDGETCVVGGQADSVHDVIELEAGQVGPAPSLARRWRSDVVRGVVRRGEEFVIVLDVTEVFAAEDLAVAAPTTAGGPLPAGASSAAA